jgi:hypothetical protein
MKNLLSAEENLPEFFTSDYENCTLQHKLFADVPFEIPELELVTIDKFFNGSENPHSGKYTTDNYLKGMLHLYRHPQIRTIHGFNSYDHRLLGRMIQKTYN